MAKATGPLFSLEASGTIAKTVTYSRWKGRPYVRVRTIPLNPYEVDQVKARNRIRAMAPAVHWANYTTQVLSGETEKDETRIRAITPDTFAWNGFLVDKGIGSKAIDYDYAEVIWGVLSAGQKTAWDNCANGLTPPMFGTAQGATGGGYSANMTSGNVLMHYMYALFKMGLYTQPNETPPVYA
jgi:hypothetical protein